MRLKALLPIFFIFSLLTYSNWQIVQVLDEFNEKTGKLALENKIFESRKIRLDLGGELNTFVLNITVPGVVEEGEKNFLIKIDNNNPLSFKGEILATDEGILTIKIPQSFGFFDISKNKNNFKILLRQMLEGKILKVQFFNDKNQSVIERFDLADFNQTYPELIRKK